MDAFNFINFLKNPGYLNQVTFQELNNLIEQYPFCQNLHYLALRKAQNEDHKDFVKKLELAATYSPNRQWLYKKLQETPTPLAMSDELITEEDALEGTEMESVMIAPNVAIDEVPEEFIPTSVFQKEEIPPLDLINENAIDPEIEEDIDAMFDELEGESANDELQEDLIENNTPQISKPPIETDTITSHSVSDNDHDIMSLTTDESDANLENPEDMKLPDDKDSKVIYMEDLVEKIPPLEESQPTDEPIEQANQNFTPEHVELEEDVPQESSAISDTNIVESLIPNIPFEVVDKRNEIIEEETEIPSEAEAPVIEPEIELNESPEEEIDIPVIPEPETEQHLVRDNLDQIDQAASPAESIENIPLAAIKNETESFNENEIDMDDKNDSTDDSPEEGKQGESNSIAPMPKSAFSSWKRKTDITPPPSPKTKKVKKPKEEEKNIDVSDLFKKEKKKKKKKKSKKKLTKLFAMESLLEHEDVISETLAEILAEQGSKKKAVKMYKRLIKIHPDKEAIYLNRIEELKKED